MSENVYQDAVKEYGTSIAAAKALGIAASTFGDRLRKEKAGIPLNTVGRPRGKTVQQKPRSLTGLSAEELLLKHSSEHQIRHAAEQLVEGTYIPEAEFIRYVGVSGGYRHIVERQEFEKYRGKASGAVIYWSHPKSIAARKEDRTFR